MPVPQRRGRAPAGPVSPRRTGPRVRQRRESGPRGRVCRVGVPPVQRWRGGTTVWRGAVPEAGCVGAQRPPNQRCPPGPTIRWRRAQGAGRRAQGAGRRGRAQGAGRRAQGAGRRAQGAGRSGAGRRAQGAGRRAQGAGRRAQVFGGVVSGPPFLVGWAGVVRPVRQNWLARPIRLSRPPAHQLPIKEGQRDQRARLDPSGVDPELLHHRAHRPRQVHAGRPHAADHRGRRRPPDARAVPRPDGHRAGTRHHRQIPGRPHALDRALRRRRGPGLRAQHDRHPRPRRLHLRGLPVASPPAKARSSSSTPPRASRRRPSRTSTWR